MYNGPSIAAMSIATIFAAGCQSKTASEPTLAPVDARGRETPTLTPETVTVAKLGAVPVWQTVVDRARYLERRGQRGIAYGSLGDAATSPYRWLVDDTEGNGALAIRIALPPGQTAASGDRVAVGGAWAVDDTQSWFWRATTVTPLPALPAIKPKDPLAQPGHVAAEGELPRDARPISAAKEGELCYFSVVTDPPVLDGEGWLVADSPAGRPYALLNMVGERASFGAQDLREPGERWRLKRGETYWVRIGPVHRHGAEKLATINARTAPVRVTTAAKK